jgi:Flp pilus assembly pilin Flp
MRAVTRAIASRLLGERGATAVEYALLLSLIAMAIVVPIYILGAGLTFVFEGAANGLSTPAPAPAGHGAPATVAPPPVHYDSCDAVRAAGAAPIHVGDPGYSPALDPDGDGVGCE